MKTANNYPSLGLKKIGLAAIGLCIATFSGCAAYSVTHVEPMLKHTPTPSRTNITQAVQCMGNTLNNSRIPRAYIFMVRDLPDGTVKQGPYQNGPMSDAGRTQFINTLSEHLHPHVGLVTDKYPDIFQQARKENIGLNRFGLPSSNNVRAFTSIFKGIIDAARQSRRLPPVSQVIPLVVDGSFTRMDSDNYHQYGDAHNGGFRGDSNNRQSGQIDFGNTQSARAITLAINLVDPRTNLVVAARSFDLQFSRTNDKRRFRIALGDGFYGYSRNEVIVEGLHSAQQTLLDAAAMWVIEKSYGDKINFSACLTPAQLRTVGK